MSLDEFKTEVEQLHNELIDAINKKPDRQYLIYIERSWAANNPGRCPVTGFYFSDKQL